MFGPINLDRPSHQLCLCGSTKKLSKRFRQLLSWRVTSPFLLNYAVILCEWICESRTALGTTHWKLGWKLQQRKIIIHWKGKSFMNGICEGLHLHSHSNTHFTENQSWELYHSEQEGLCNLPVKRKCAKKALLVPISFASQYIPLMRQERHITGAVCQK